MFIRSMFILFLLVCKNFAADFDCVVIGTSPVLLFEALYKDACGQKVLLLEAAGECGGAWKSIDICGVRHVDMGCHEISSTPELNRFLEEYAGCRIIPYFQHNYFSNGCFELIDHLLRRIEKSRITLKTNCKVESVYLDPERSLAVLNTQQGVFTASKIVATAGSSFAIDNSPLAFNKGSHRFYHLYLLIQDPSSPRFSYRSGGSSGVSRMMNLTQFTALPEKDTQLIVFQTRSDPENQNVQSILDDLKKANLIDPNAFLLQKETYTYEQNSPFQISKLPPSQQTFFEVLNTSHFNVLQTYIMKWKKALTPYEPE